MTRFAMGMNISRLSAPLYPDLENILHQTMTAKTIETIPIIPAISPKLAIAAVIWSVVVWSMLSAPSSDDIYKM